MKCIANILVILSILLLESGKGDTSLKQIHILFRHGERSPTKTYPTDPNKDYPWPGGLGHLTNRGKFQIFKLGEMFKQTYREFIPKYYSPDNLKLFSSYADRCLMSAESFTAGFFPPTDDQIWNSNLMWQPIPVHYKPRSLDNFIAMKQNCAKYDKILADRHNWPKVVEVFNNNTDLLFHLSQYTGMVIDDLDILENLYNTIEIEQNNNLTVPTAVAVNDTVLETMKELAALNLALYSETEYMKRVKGGVLVKRVLDAMKNITENKDSTKIYLYSGHDLTIVHVLRALNLTETIKPDFGASIAFELHTNQTSDFMRIVYRNGWNAAAEEKPIKNCENCDLTSLETFLSPIIPSDWASECSD